METIILKQPYSFPVPHEAPADQLGIGGGAVFLRDRWPRTRYTFAITTPPLPRQEAEELEGLLMYLKGSGVLWYDGADFGTKANPVLIGRGDGTTTDFFLPHGNVFGASALVYVTQVLTTGWTITEASGLLRFTTAPVAEARITAAFTCRFRCFVAGAKAQRDRLFRNLYRVSFTLKEKPNA